MEKGHGLTTFQKATGASELGCPSSHRGITTLKGKSIEIPEPKAQEDFPIDSVNQDSGTREHYSDDKQRMVDLRKYRNVKHDNARKARQLGNGHHAHSTDKFQGMNLVVCDTERFEKWSDVFTNIDEEELELCFKRSHELFS
uniref:Uncharacterized protein n=1 Tax=Cannabis sativa TaxID=3483 RepID=A0A803PHH7_CANSA